MRALLVGLLSLCACYGWAEEPASLGQLIESVRDTSTRDAQRLAEREERFVAARDQRSELLARAQQQRRAAEAEADRLRAEYEDGEEELADLETRLDENTGDLREVFSVVRQTSGDAVPMIQNSLVSAQLGARGALVERLSAANSIPSADDLRELWLLFLDEMNESGRIARFDAAVISADGEESVRTVTRIGTFSALSNGDYLRYLPDSGRLLALARQPVGVESSDILAFEEADESLLSVAIDPSRGAILSLIVQTPDLRERIDQGGVIGYIILVIGALGLVLGVERFVTIGLARRNTRGALSGKNPDADPAVSQLRTLSRDADYLADADALSAKMDEIVSTATEKLRRGLPTLAIFAAVSPLLGLLGTVTGMIETFQVITLFGAGDPRLMSGGISQALITTQLGLSVAIPLLLIHSFVQGRANALITTLDETAAELFAEGRTHPQSADAV